MRTRVTTALGIQHPVLSAGMGPMTNLDLVAAVSNAGGLGILGAFHLSGEQIHQQVAALRTRTTRPFALNLLLAFCTAEQIQACLEAQVPVLSTAWGDPTDVARQANAARIPHVHMVTTAAEAVVAARAGVTVIAAQGNEAGGGLVGPVCSLPLIPAVIDALNAEPRESERPPVIAAGGVADGRGLVAALALGAEGVLIGTRFLATFEAPVTAARKEAICVARETDTVYTPIANLVSRPTWASVAPSRVLRTRAIEEWLGREHELAAATQAERRSVADRWAQARDEGRIDGMEIITGQDCGLIHDVLPAAEVVRRVVAEAEDTLRRLAAQYMSSEDDGRYLD